MRAFLLIAMVCLLVSCEEDEEVTYDITGDYGELTIFIPAEFRDQGIEDKLEDELYKTVPGLMIEEKSLRLKFMKEEQMKDVRVRNLLEIDIKPKNKTEFFVKKENPKIPEQYHIILRAKSLEDALSLIDEKGHTVEQGVNAREDDRIKSYIHRKRRPEIAKNIKKRMGVRMVISREFNHMVVNNKEFSYVKGTDHKIGMRGKMLLQNFLFVVSVPDDHTEMAMDVSRLKFIVNKHLKQHVAYDTGLETDTAFIQISPEKDFPIKTQTTTTSDGNEALDFSGHFGVYRTTMKPVPFGGYFTARAIKDEGANRIIVTIAACNVPAEFGYRENLRLLQGMINTVRV